MKIDRDDGGKEGKTRGNEREVKRNGRKGEESQSGGTWECEARRKGRREGGNDKTADVTTTKSRAHSQVLACHKNTHSGVFRASPDSGN